MLSSLFDEYSLGARVRPSLLALLPLIVTTYVVAPSLYNLATTLFSIIVACGLITALAHYSRHQGRKAEKRLISLWGGKLTTILLRRTDTTIDRHTKGRYYDYLSESINHWHAPTIEAEQNDSVQADEYYESAVRWLLEKTRDTKKYRLLFKENISYGFRRNSLGIKIFGIILSLIPPILIVAKLQSNTDYLDIEKHLLEYGLIAFSIILLSWWSFVVNDSWVKDAAESYALKLLSVCENED